jgi:uncharacterized protein (TIGR04376 family)
MSLFEDFSRFLETRLEEFLRSNPDLELQALEEQLRKQEEDTLRLLADLQRQEKGLQDQILSAAQEIQRWHLRAEKAKAAGRQDLARAAQEREASLLRQGNQLWGQMQGVKARFEKTKELYKLIQTRRKEVRAKAAEVAATKASSKKADSSWETAGWNKSYSGNIGGADSLDETFKRWEADEELEQLKRKMGR